MFALVASYAPYCRSDFIFVGNVKLSSLIKKIPL